MKKTFILLVATAATAALAQTPPAATPAAAPSQQIAPAPEVLATTKLTLDEAIQRALQVNNTVERSRADIAVAEANRKYLLSNVLPRIVASGATTRNSENVSFNAGGRDTTVLASNDWNYRVVLSQPIFAGRRELRAYSQAKIGVENAKEGVLGTEDAIILRVASDYLALVNADATLDIERKNIELAEQERRQAQAFYEAGEKTKVDVLRAGTALKGAQRAYAIAQQARDNAVSRLRAELDLDTNIEAASPARDIAPLPDESMLIQQAEANRPDVQVAQNNLRIAQLEIQKQKGFWLPTVTFDGGYVQQKSQFPAPKYAYGSFRFNVPLWQSGEVEARVAAARARELQAQLDLDTAKTTAREDVRTATADLRSAETTLTLAKEQLTAAEAEYAQVSELYRAQEATSLDVLSSEATLASARRTVAEDTLNRNLAILRVWYASGSLKQALNVKPAATQAAAASSDYTAETNESPAAVVVARTESGAVQK